MVMHSLQAERIWIDVHKNEAQGPWKKLEGDQFAVSTKNLSFSRLWNEVTMRSLENANSNHAMPA